MSYVWEGSTRCQGSMHLEAYSGVMLEYWISLSTLMFMPLLLQTNIAGGARCSVTVGLENVACTTCMQHAQQPYNMSQKKKAIMQDLCDVIMQPLLPTLQEFQKAICPVANIPVLGSVTPALTDPFSERSGRERM